MSTFNLQNAVPLRITEKYNQLLNITIIKKNDWHADCHTWTMSLKVKISMQREHMTDQKFKGIKLPERILIADAKQTNLSFFFSSERAREIHLPNHEPTMKVSTNYFNINSDNSDFITGRYYVTKVNWPWALNFPQGFNRLIEKGNIQNTYPSFKNWANLSGNDCLDWYLESNSNNEFIYKTYRTVPSFDSNWCN